MAYETPTLSSTAGWNISVTHAVTGRVLLILRTRFPLEPEIDVDDMVQAFVDLIDAADGWAITAVKGLNYQSEISPTP
jgi:hypothetical protein